MITLVLAEISLVTSATLLNPDFYTKNLTNVGYYQNLKLEIEKGFTNLGLASGLPESVFQDSIEESWLKTEMNHSIENVISFLTMKGDLGYVPNTQPVQARLHQNITDYALGLGVNVPQESLNQIDKMLMNILNEHLNLVNSNSPLLINGQKVTSFIDLNRFLLFIPLLLLLIIIYLINRKGIKDFLTWLSYAITTAGAFLILPTVLTLRSSILKRLAISNGYLRDALSTLLAHYFSIILTTGILTFLVGILLLIGAQKFPSQTQ